MRDVRQYQGHEKNMNTKLTDRVRCALFILATVRVDSDEPLLATLFREPFLTHICVWFRDTVFQIPSKMSNQLSLGTAPSCDLPARYRVGVGAV